MKQAGVKARFIRAGSNKYLVEMLEQGLTDYILDGQTFDLDGVRSMRDNPKHIATSPFTSYNFHGKGNFASLIDAAVLGATEVDTSFNANVVTHSDGRLLHGIGGLAELPVRQVRDTCSARVPGPHSRDCRPGHNRLRPGELIDVIITERGICINPLRQDLLDAVKNSSLPLKPIEQLKAEIDAICGKPEKARLGEKPVALVKWVDGTVIDSVWQVSKR